MLSVDDAIARIVAAFHPLSPEKPYLQAGTMALPLAGRWRKMFARRWRSLLMLSRRWMGMPCAARIAARAP